MHIMITSILLKFLTLKWDISRTMWRIKVSDGSCFFAFFTPEFSFKPSLLILTNVKDIEIIGLIYDHASIIPCCFIHW